MSTPHISVFTPSHDPRWLECCLQSLLRQSFTSWEWIVLLNGGATWKPSVDDPRINVTSAEATGVGAAKRLACSAARGKYLVELDHDDELRSDALELIAETFASRPDAGFVYSHFAQMTEEGDRDESRFDERNGWTYATSTSMDGSSCSATRCFHIRTTSVTSGSLRITFAHSGATSTKSSGATTRTGTSSMIRT